MSKIPNKLVSESLESSETYASVASQTRSKGKSVVMEQQKMQQVEDFVKEVDQQLMKFMTEVYESQCKTNQQFNQQL